MFEARSLALNAAFISFLFSVIIFAYHLGIGRSRHTRWWATGNLAVAVGFLLLIFQGSAPDWLSINVANALLVGGLLSYIISVNYLAGGKPPLRVAVLILAVQVLLFALLPVLTDQPNVRVMTMALISVCLSIWLSAGSGRLLHLIRSSIPVRMMQLVFLIFGLASLLRFFMVLMNPDASAFSTNSAASAFYLIVQILIVGSTLGLMLIHNQKLARELEERQARLIELNRSRERVFSIIGHDLVGGISNVRLLGDNLNTTADYMDTDTLRSIAKVLISSSDRLLSILRNLVEWSSSLRSGNSELRLSYNLDQLVAIAIDQVSSEAEAKEIAIQYLDSPTAPFLANHGALETVIRNLLVNAIKFTGNGGSVTLTAGTEDGWFHLDVRDTGCGMDPDKVAAFSRGEPLESSRGSAGENGFGLGLGLCRELMAEQGGSLVILDSTPGAGTCFRVSLRLAK